MTIQGDATEPGPESKRCSLCGEAIEPGDGFHLSEPAGERRAAFCRLEHVVPWALQGAHWQPGTIPRPPGLEESLASCSQCGAPLPDVYVLLVQHMGERGVPDAFCSVDHLADWAREGGRGL